MTTTTTSTTTRTGTSKRSGVPELAVGVLAYLMFAAAFGYFLIWFAGVDVPRLKPLGLPATAAALVNLALVGLFGVTHSVMARTGFKRWIVRHIPPSTERSVYVAVASATLALLPLAWQAVGGTVWDAGGAARGVLYAGYVAGVVLVFWVSFQLNHLHLTGVAQTWARFRQRSATEPRLRTTVLYRWVRHPMNTALLVLCWSVPTMTGARLEAASLLTLYILIGQWLEERDLRALHGDGYHRYARRVPALVPRPRRERE